MSTGAPDRQPNDNPQHEYEQELHRRLLAEDEAASRDAYHRLLPKLLARLKKQFPSPALAQDVEDCAIESLAKYVLTPTVYRPGGRSLIGFLYMDARGDLLNIVDRKRPVLQCELPLEAAEMVAAEDEGRNDLMERELIIRVFRDAAGLPPNVTLDDLKRRVKTVLPTQRDQEFLQLWLTGERDPTSYSRLLGVEGKSHEEQLGAVKKTRDRIGKTLLRLGRGYSGG